MLPCALDILGVCCFFVLPPCGGANEELKVWPGGLDAVLQEHQTYQKSKII